MATMFIQTEPTPNPATLKFMPGRTVMESGSRDFASAEDAEASPLAAELFTLGDVNGVFFGRDFVSVTAAPDTDWSRLKGDVAAILLDHFAVGMPLFYPSADAGAEQMTMASEDTHDGPDAEIVAQIRDLIETRIRPAVANDGGDIVYRGYDKGHVFLQMQGACSGCPSATITLKRGIESLLKHYVPEIVEVHAV